MVAEIDKLRERLDSYWNHIDVLTLAVSRARSTRFTPDIHKWHSFVSEWKERTRESAPRLFEDVFFDRNDPFPPYSKQIESFFTVMRRSGAMVLWISGGRSSCFEVPSSIKMGLTENTPRGLREYKYLIDEMAKDMDTKLGLAYRG